MRIKRILCILLSLILVVTLISCSCDEKETEQGYTVTGKVYKADKSTINIGWDDKNQLTSIETENLKSLIKIWYGNSQIEFTGEQSFKLTGTDSEYRNLNIKDCEREENELYAEIPDYRKNCSIDIVLKENSISVLFDIMSGVYFTIEYK